MKRIIRKVQKLGEKAAEFSQSMSALPPKVAEIRQALTMTSSQMQQLRSQLQNSVADLRVDTEDRLVEALQEINGSTGVFQEAGYELGGVDMEVSPDRRLIVHLNRLEEAPPAVLRGLLATNQHRRTIHAILSAILQAEEMSHHVDMENLDYQTLIVQVGPVPSVRLCWRGTEVVEEIEEVETPPSPPASTEGARPFFEKGSFFEPQAAESSISVSSGEAASAASSAPPPAAASALTSYQYKPSRSRRAQTNEPASGEKPVNPLDRFKKMPDLSR